MPQQTRRFTSYFEAGELPVSSLDLRFPSGSDVIMALADHGPAPGLSFQPVDDFIVSLVHHSSHAKVVRDIGHGQQTLVDAPLRVFVTPARTRSYWAFDGAPTVLHIAFPWRDVTDFMGLPEEEAMRRMHKLARSPFEEPLLNALAWRMWAASSKEGRAEALFAEHAERVLLATLLLRSFENPEANALGGQLAPWQLHKAQDFMHRRLDETIRLADVAKTLGLSQYHFLRAYKCSTGQTPFQWLTHQRIERAKELISHRSESLTQVALSVGFSSPGHFSTVFRRMTGMTPTAWRREFLRESD